MELEELEELEARARALLGQGAYDYVAAEVLKYVRMGCRTFILDFAPDAEELSHVASVFGRVAHQA